MNDEVKISLSLPDDQLDPSHILDLPQKIAKEKGIRMVVCIDEFQKITDWADGEAILEKLRSYWQKHKDVCYCLYGSKRTLMSTLFTQSSQPFFRFGETIFLEKIPRQEWIDFVVKQFTGTSKRLVPSWPPGLSTMLNPTRIMFNTLPGFVGTLLKKS